MLVINTWDGNNINDGVNYRSGFSPATLWGLPESEVVTISRVGSWPSFATVQRNEVKFSIYVAIQDFTSVRTLRSELLNMFNPEDETPKILVITDDGTTNPRYVRAVCESLRPMAIGTSAATDVFRIDLKVDGDVFWRSTSSETDTWSVTASGQTHDFVYDGDLEGYPIVTVRPTSGKTGGYDYRRWVSVTWRSANAGPQYPVRIDLDTATLVTAGKMQADGDDLRVLVDGIEKDRWLSGINTSSTKIWINLDFTRAPSILLRTSFLSTDTITSLDLDDEVEMALMPDEGIVLIDSEAFVYTGRSLIDRQLTGVTREAKGTSAANHTVGTRVYWIQREVYLIYGNAAATTPVEDLVYLPIFNLSTSTNTSWVYDIFGYYDLFNSGRWTNGAPLKTSGDYGCYTATERMLNLTYQVIGVWRGDVTSSQYSQGWFLHNPCGIVNAAFTGGKVRAIDADAITTFNLAYWERGASWWEYMENGRWFLSDNPLAADNTWYSQGSASWKTDFGNANASPWSAAESLTMYRWGLPGTDYEFGGCTVTLDSSETPVVSAGSEGGNYSLEATITNQLTGEAITLSFLMDTSQYLEVNTDTKTITYLKDGSSQYQCLSKSSARRQWLRFLPGTNRLRYDDTGTTAVTVTVDWVERFY